MFFSAFRVRESVVLRHRSYPFKYIPDVAGLLSSTVLNQQVTGWHTSFLGFPQAFQRFTEELPCRHRTFAASVWEKRSSRKAGPLLWWEKVLLRRVELEKLEVIWALGMYIIYILYIY